MVETARLRLRELESSDRPALHDLLTDPSVMHHYPALRTDAYVCGWYDGVRALYGALGYGPWTVELPDRTFVGQCGPLPHNVDGRLEIEIVCFIDRRFWRGGYAEEASRACIDYAFERIGVPAIVAYVLPDNRSSRRLALRCGLKFEGCFERDGTTMERFARAREPAARP